MEKYKRIHFIGVGGIGMSALARLFLHNGKEVSGSDRSESVVTDGLVEEGVKFFSTQEASNITNDIDLVVYTDAIPEDHPEKQEAMKRGLPLQSYFEALGQIANEYYLIVVTGAHGKTTTTAMVADVLEDAGLDPTVVVGSLRSKTKSNFRAGKSKYFVVEGDEYRRHFLVFQPTAVIITNIEADHLDFYRDLADIENTFAQLVERVPEDGVIIANPTSESVAKVLVGAKAKVVDYRSYIDPLMPMKAVGAHNYQNAATVLALADFLDIDKDIARNSLSNFSGTWRRFEYKGELNGAPVYDDYAHHPTEIMATIAGARDKYPEKKVMVVFQPHTYSRTEELFDGFVDALAKADRVLLLPVYAARAERAYTKTSLDIVSSLKSRGVEVEYFEGQDEVAEALRASATQSDVVIVMGAGDVTNIARVR